MTDIISRNQAARRLLADPSFGEAVSASLEAIRDELFDAATSEDREAKYQEWKALERVHQTLLTWAGSEEIRQGNLS